ncbi:MAG: [Fe-Fe] hydrogenase large subunit C-terminal domain-containing protein [archaeon]|nr:[Fe-Fe] hydrogenase large subunit C-terminal domain-containing protein [archaeon]
MQNSLNEVKRVLDSNKKIVLMLAPSFVAEFNYPDILIYLKKAGFDKLVELTFGAKIINKKYHKILECSNCFLISSVCPGIVSIIKKEYSQFIKNLIPVLSPMVATARLCKKIYPNHKILFISPCNFKKVEALENKDCVDFVLDYQELRLLLSTFKINPDKQIKNSKEKILHFDKFYNDYTKIYPLAGGLSKTAHIKGILAKEQTKIIDGILKVKTFLNNPNKKVKFLDCNFCKGGCIGGPSLSPNKSLSQKKKKILAYVEKARHEKIPSTDKGILRRAEGIRLTKKY